MASAALTMEELESRALALSEHDRARLVSSLLSSLLPDSGALDPAWLDEAERRDREMGDDPDRGSPADEVFRRARTRLG